MTGSSADIEANKDRRFASTHSFSVDPSNDGSDGGVVPGRRWPLQPCLGFSPATERAQQGVASLGLQRSGGQLASEPNHASHLFQILLSEPPRGTIGFEARGV